MNVPNAAISARFSSSNVARKARAARVRVAAPRVKVADAQKASAVTTDAHPPASLLPDRKASPSVRRSPPPVHALCGTGSPAKSSPVAPHLEQLVMNARLVFST